MKKTAFQLYHKTSGHFPFKMLFGGASFWLFRAGFFPAFFSFLLQWIGWTDFPLFSSSGFEAETLNGPTFRAFFLQACFLQAARTLTGPIFRAPFFKWFKAGPFAGPVSCACSARSSSKQEKQEQKKSFSQPAFYGGSFLIRAVKNPLSTFSLSRIFF